MKPIFIVDEVTPGALAVEPAGAVLGDDPDEVDAEDPDDVVDGEALLLLLPQAATAKVAMAATAAARTTRCFDNS